MGIKEYIVKSAGANPVVTELVVEAAELLDVSAVLINFAGTNQPANNLENGQNFEHGFWAIASTKGIVDPAILLNAVSAAEHGFRFYASVPISCSEGLNRGFICVACYNPRCFTEEDKASLNRIAEKICELTLSVSPCD